MNPIRRTNSAAALPAVAQARASHSQLRAAGSEEYMAGKSQTLSPTTWSLFIGPSVLALLHCNSTQRGSELENTVFWKVLKSMNSLCSFCLFTKNPKDSKVEHIKCNLIFKHKLLSLNSFTFIKQWIGQFFKEMAEIWIVEGEKNEVGTVRILPLGHRKKQIAWYILFLNFLTSISWLLLSNGTEHSVKKLTGSPSLSKLSRKYFTDSP